MGGYGPYIFGIITAHVCVHELIDDVLFVNHVNDEFVDAHLGHTKIVEIITKILDCRLSILTKII